MPRHYSTAQYCVACRLRCAICVCAIAPRLQLATRLILYVHYREWGTATNTGHLARLALSNTEVRIHGQPSQVSPRPTLEVESGSTLALFPGRGEALTPELLASWPRPFTLLVPDGNWHQAKKMIQRVPLLRQAKPVCLDGPSFDFGLRRNIREHRRSTFEAIAQALGILEGPQTESDLLAFFRMVLERKRGIPLRT